MEISLKNYRIHIKNQGIEIEQQLIQAAGDEFSARLFLNRGITDPDKIREMLDKDKIKLTDPFEFADMTVAIERIKEAIEQNQLIAIYGDYDVDGVTATVTFLENLSVFTSNLIFHVPDRFTEGYGMNLDVIKGLSQKGVNLVITCDCGISNIEEVKLIKQLGMDVIITDHHSLPDELPEALAVINPKLLPEGHKARDISGCATAYFVCRALGQKMVKFNEEKSLDLVALSLIADVVPLLEENRALIKLGIPKLLNPNRLGLKKLYEIAGRKSKIMNEEDIAYQVAPRLNAAGRLDSARLSVKLLLSEKENKATEYAEEIDKLNNERKTLQENIIKQAKEMAENEGEDAPLYVFYNQDWHHGIIGIAAGRLCEEYGKPTILLSLKEDGNTVVGSARSTESVDIFSLIATAEDLLMKFGGHWSAAGLSLKLENVEEFKKRIQVNCEVVQIASEEKIIEVDDRLDSRTITEIHYEKIKAIGPYGEGFLPPVFYSETAKVVKDRLVGNGHHIMELEGLEKNIKAVRWNGEMVDYTGKYLDIVYDIGLNVFNGNSQLQLSIRQLEESEILLNDNDKYIVAEKETLRFDINKIEIIDKRELTFLELDMFLKNNTKFNRKNILIYFEGLECDKKFQEAVGLQELSEADILIFESAPSSLASLDFVINKVKPSLVITSYLSNISYTPNTFINKLLGVIKYIVNQKDGRTDIDYLISKLNVDSRIIEVSLAFLKVRGYIYYSINESNNLIITLNFEEKSKEKNDLIGKKMYKQISDALIERNAFIEYITSNKNWKND